MRLAGHELRLGPLYVLGARGVMLQQRYECCVTRMQRIYDVQNCP